MDDIPVGGGGGEKMIATSSIDQADVTGPLEQRIVSKNWKSRAVAYDELSAMCENAQVDSREPFFSEYVVMWKEILKDSNPGALEKALACLEKFLQKCKSNVLLDYQNNIIISLVEKCFGHAKPVIKQKSAECFLLIFECSENFEISIDTLIALATNKNQKVQIGGTQAIAILVENFGIKKIKIVQFAETMIKNAQNTTPDVKKAAYDYYKAVYKWIGDAILPQITDKLKPQQIEELQKLFAEIKALGNKDKRVVRSEKAQEEEAKKNALIDAAMAEENKTVEEVIDPLEFAPEVDILQKFNVEWQEKVAAIKKWDEKVQNLTDLTNACKNVRIKNGNYENLAQFLKKEINAVHVSITASAIEASATLANGLKKDFQPYIKHLISPVLLKFKEKKQAVTEKIIIFLDSTLQCTDLEQIKEDIIMGLTNAAPLVKQGTIKYLDKAAIVTYIDVLQRIADDILPAMLKAIDDKDSTVRDLALHCMGILKGRYGDSIMAKYMKGIDVKQKLDKIEEAQKEVKPTKYDRAENWKPPAPKKVVEKKKAANEDEDELMNFDQKPKKAPPKNIGQKPKPKIEEDQIMTDSQNNEDQLMSFDIKPKKAPPKNIGQKPQKKEDEEMKTEEVAPKKAPPALSTAKPKTVASSGPSKPPSVPIIEDEDLGSGLSKEEACDKVQEFFNSSTIELFDKDKWQDKKSGFEELEKEIIEKQPSPVILEAVAKFVKTKMKDWKESNINLQKAIVAIFDCIVKNCEKINKRTMQCAMSYFIDKIGDVKMQESIKTMLMTASELVTPKFISLQVIKYAATAKSPNNLTQSCVILTDIIEEFGVGGIPLKETIDYGKLATAHATPAVRLSAMKLFCSIYKQVGDVIKNFLTDIKESTLKMITDEFDKITVYKKGEFQKKRNVRGEAAEQEEAPIGGKKGKGGGGGADDLLASLPREDISKKLTSKLIEQFKNKDWKLRKKGGDDVEAILREAKMRIEPNGLNELMENIKMLMKDPNKAVVKVFISLLGLLAEAIGNPIKQYTKKCFVPMLNNLSDKQTLVRQDVIVTMNKWAEAIGADQIINNISPILIIENPEFRTEGLNWILQNTTAIQTCDHQSLLKPLISCLLDKSKEIRTKTEEIISLVMPVLGYQEFLNATKDQKPAVQQTLKPILEKIKSQCNAGQGPAPNAGVANNQESDDMKQTLKKDTNNKKIISQTQPIKIEKEEQKQVIGSFQKLALEKKNNDKKAPESARESVAPKPLLKQNTNNDEDEVRINPQNKSKRAQQDAKSKYPINEVKGDHIEKLQYFCNDIFGTKFSDQMFAKSQDFQKHIKCVETLEKLIDTQFEQMTEVLDIIFKWGVLRMNESSNTKLLMSIFDFYGILINNLIEKEYKMQEFEMIILISTLCEKNGHNISTMKEKARKLLKLCFELYDKKQCYRLIVENGVKSKNLKAVSECLEEISDYIVQNGVDSITKKDFELFLKNVDNADKSVRESSLKVFAESYTHLGEDIWRLLSKDISPKVKSLLEARFKTVQKKSGGASVTNLNISMRSSGMNSSAMKIKPQNELSITNNSQSKKKNLQNSIGSLQFKKPINGTNKMDRSMKSDNQISGGSIPDEQPQEDDFQSAAQKIQNHNQNEINLRIKQSPPIDQKEPQNQDQQLQDVFQGKKQLQNDINKQDQEMIDESKQQEDDQSVIINQNKKIQERVDEIPKEPRKVNIQNLEQALNEAENKLELDVDPELKKQQQFILNHINQLKNGDLLKRVDSLVALNEVISGLGNQNQADPQNNSESLLQQKALIQCCDDLIHAFSQVMNDIFSYPVHEIPLRFTKYFITIVNKTCSQKEIMREVSYVQVSSLVEQLLTRLLIDNLDKIGTNKEGELILKNLNSSMLRMLENCSHTYIFVVLFELLTKFKDDQTNHKVPSLIIKCLLKLSKNMEKIIEKIDLKRFFVAIHEYISSIGNNRSNNDDLGMRIAKTLVNEIVKLKKEQIWEFFDVIENHQKQDQHLKKWIQIILRSLQDGSRPSTLNQNQMQNSQIGVGNTIDQSQQEKIPQSRMYVEFEIKKIIQDLHDAQKYENAIQRLDKFSKTNPSYDYTKNLQKESAEFAQQVKFDLNKFRNGLSNTSTNNTSGGQGGSQIIQPQDQMQRKMNSISSASNLQNAFHAQRQSNIQQPLSQDLNNSLNKQSAFQSKMAQFQKRQSMMGGVPTQSSQNLSMSNQGQVQQQVISNNQNNLNTSFSDLNQKLSNQWANIQNSNKKTGQFTGRPTVTQSTSSQLAQTINIAQGVGMRNSAFVGQNSQNQLNTSNNQFKNRLMQGNLANRLQTKQTNNESLGGKGEETGIIGQKTQTALEQMADQNQNKIQSLNKSSNVGNNNNGGISNNSFRSRLQGLKVSSQNTQNVEQTQTVQVQPKPISQQPVTSVDLQKRLADMKAKLQGLKNN